MAVPRVGRHARAERDAELHRRQPDAARCAVHEQPLARREPALREERVVRGRVDLDEAAGGRPVERLGHRQRQPLVHDGQLGMAAAAEQRHHTVADREAKRVRPDRRDLARALEAGNVLRRVAAAADSGRRAGRDRRR